MNRKIDTESKIKTILEKTETKLRMIAKDPDVISYNYYNDSKFVGAKIMRNKKITLEQVAEDLASLTKTVTDLAKVVIEGFAEQKKFNEEQKKYNKKIDRIEILVELMASTPTMKKELEELKKKK